MTATNQGMSRQVRIAVLIGSLVVVGGLSYFWISVLSAPSQKDTNAKPSSAASAPAAPVPDTEHETKMLEEELRRKPGHVPILFRLAELARQKGQPVEAAGHLREILKQEPGNAEARLELGRSLYEAGDVADALEETRKLVEAQPKDPDALYNLGAIYANMSNLEMAHRYWSQAVAAAPASDSGRKAKQALTQIAGNTPARR